VRVAQRGVILRGGNDSGDGPTNDDGDGPTNDDGDGPTNEP
jgi:hypothetical protein